MHLFIIKLPGATPLGTWASRLLAAEVVGRSGGALPIVFTADWRAVLAMRHD